MRSYAERSVSAKVLYTTVTLAGLQLSSSLQKNQISNFYYSQFRETIMMRNNAIFLGFTIRTAWYLFILGQRCNC